MHTQRPRRPPSCDGPQSRRTSALAWLGVALVSLAALLGCRERASAGEPAAPAEAPSGAPSVSSSAPAHASRHPQGDAEQGRKLMETFECGRCHQGAMLSESPLEQHCAACHAEIMDGRFKAPQTELAKWQPVVKPYRDIPSLDGAAERFTASWLTKFLLEPHDLRPHLAQSMPRLALTEEQAAHLAAYLTEGAAQPREVPASGTPSQGRALMEQKGCTSCHVMTGVPAFATQPDLNAADERTRRAALLAPDLRFSRERMPRATAARWVRDPTSVNRASLMPSTSLSQSEALDIVAYLYDTPLTAAPRRPIPERLPKLSRPVRYQEVFEQVFSKTCVHCHGDPLVARGDGGPGNTGGFGFKPRQLNLSSYSALLSGLVDAEGQRISAFKPTADGTPRLVAALLARQAEEAGEEPGEVRGMPLSLPSLTPVQIQLVESWIAQGRPR